MNPSRYQLPQHCSPDRQRARRATLALERTRYPVAGDVGAGHPSPELHLPPAIAELPPSEGFGAEKKTRLLLHKLFAKAQAPFVRIALSGSAMDTLDDYVRVRGWLPEPRTQSAWRSDADFARQRLQGVNPRSLFRWHEPPTGAVADAIHRGDALAEVTDRVDALAGAADRVLREHHATRLGAALDAGRLFGTAYPLLEHPLVQSQVRRHVTLASPTCVFFLDEAGELHPVAIQLRPLSGPVLTPLDGSGDWLLARTHAQSADAHYHEAIFHLLETHMVSEAFAIASGRELHPDHPLRQLLHVHFEWNLAIDDVARHDLLSPGGPIDLVFGAGVGGVLDLARLAWRDWSFEARGFREDLAERGVGDKPLQHYYYREDGTEIHAALGDYAERILRLWYLDDAAVGADCELQAWARTLAGWIPRGFPAQITSRAQLVAIATEVIFRASAGHASVNNGQYDAYGFVPNAPGALAAGLPGAGGSKHSEEQVLAALPGAQRTLAAIGMSWTLSQPTHHSLLTSGEVPAFAKELNPAAYDAVDALRSRLRRISASIRARNRTLAEPYTYLDPGNVGRSAGI